MKVRELAVVRIDFPRSEPRSRPRRTSWAEEAEVANPMSRYAAAKRHRNRWLPRWEQAWCRVTAEDGTCGIAALPMARAVATPSVPWLECFVAAPPGVPLEEAWRLPGLAIPRDGWLEPNDAPGFGMDVPESWIRSFG